MRPEVVLHARVAAGRWFGIACAGEELVATAVASTRARALGVLRRSLSPGVVARTADEHWADHVERIFALLVELEAGEEGHKCFALSSAHVAEPLATVLKTAAAIPLGYVGTYGAVAKASGTDARVVGGIMASNPLYPIVPCHRVVGADLSLVGYAGSKGPAALEAKLERLTREVRGFTAPLELLVGARPFTVVPVEWAIAKARGGGPRQERQRLLFE